MKEAWVWVEPMYLFGAVLTDGWLRRGSGWLFGRPPEEEGLDGMVNLIGIGVRF